MLNNIIEFFSLSSGLRPIAGLLKEIQNHEPVSHPEGAGDGVG